MSNLENRFNNAWQMFGEIEPTYIHDAVKVTPNRRWRFDFAWPEFKVAVEMEGLNPKGKSRHTQIKGYSADCDKYNTAALNGWIVLRFTQLHMKDARAQHDAVMLVVQALRMRGWHGTIRVAE